MAFNASHSLGKVLYTLWFMLLIAVLPLSQAAKVYKWTDESGNISYRDKPPPENDGHVEEKHIDPNKNVVQPFRSPIKGSGKSQGRSPQTSKSTQPADSDQKDTAKKAGIVDDAKLDSVDPASGANPNPLSIRPTPQVTPAPLSAPPAPTAPPAPVTPPPAPVPPLPAPSAPGQ